ncbi:MAG: SpaA isopeptide-forming pilin-related protein [Oscillospiraceae bacterium]
MKHNLHKMLCLLLVAVLLWGTLPVALATALPVDTGQAAEPAPEASTAPTKEGTEPTEVSQPVPEETAEPQEPPAGETLPVDVPADADAPITEDAVSPQGSVTGTVTRSDDINGYYYFWGDAIHTYHFTYADGTAATANLGGMCIHYVDGEIAYCIEPNVSSESDVTYTGTAGSESTYWQTKLTAQQRQAISLVLLYGAPNYTNSADKDTEFGYEGATQVLIWEIVMGLRSATAPYTRSDRQLYDTFAGGDFPSFDTGYAKIVELMQAHLTIPSFSARSQAAAPEITLTYDGASGLYKASVTDTNGVLASDYSFTATGVTMTKSGNTLNISAPLSALENGSVLASATGRSLDAGNMAYMIWTASGQQTVATVSTTADPVKAYFRVKADTIPAHLEILKTSDDGNVSGISFTLEESVPGIGYCRIGTYTTDSGGKISVPNLTVGTKYRVTETVPEGYEAEVQSQEITLQPGANTLTFVNHRLLALEIHKTSDDGEVAGISFTVEQLVPGSGYQNMGTYTTDADGKISIPGLSVGTTLRVTEQVPPNYAADKKTQVITLQAGDNVLTFVNHYMLADLEILKTSPDGKVDGIAFTVTDSRGTVVGSGVTDQDGRLVVPGLTKGVAYTVEETVPEGYVCDNPRQTVILQAGTNTVTFENRPIYGSIALTKIDEADPSVKLSGAEFTVTGPDGSTQVMEETETGVYKLEHLRYGHYTIRETKAPEGYVLNDAIFEVNITEEKTYVVKAEGFQGVPNRQQVGSIQVKKVDPEGKPLAGASFLLEYSEDGKSWNPVRFREKDSVPTVGGCTSAELKDGVLVTGEDGTALFSGLSISIGENHIYYRLTETTAPEGYTLLPEPVFEGELPQNGSRDITVTAVNTPQFTLPFTGSMGFSTVTFGLLLAEFALCTVVFLFRKKKQEG